MIENIMLLIAASVGAWAVGAGAGMALEKFWEEMEEDRDAGEDFAGD